MSAMHPALSARQFAEQDLTAFLLNALQREHPEWVQADGDCPSCRDYATKLQTILPQQSPA